MSHSQDSNEFEEEGLKILADCIYERFQKVPLLEGDDPFEYYAHQLRAGCYKDRSLFLQRFLKGYRLIKGETASSDS